MSRDAVIAEARSWIGTPFHHQARIKGVGVDCGQLLAAVYETACDMEPMDFGYYPRDWFLHADDERYMDQVAARCKPVDEPQPGDIALFKIGRAYAHGAIVIDWPMVIHARWNTPVEYFDVTKPPLAGREVLFFSPFK